MPAELRKRKAPPPPPVTRPAKKKNTGESTVKKVKEAVKKVLPGTAPAPAPTPLVANAGDAAAVDVSKTKTPETVAPKPVVPEAESTTKTSGAPNVGDVVDLGTFGGEVETHDGKKVTLKQLVDESKAGVVLFTYPKANTPGCTKQACAFRDGHDTLTSGGLAIYGLSGDSPKSNTTFVTKQSLPYTLLCNPSYSLIGAIGMQNGSAHKTNRGVFAVDKSGKVLLNFLGGPIPTVDEVKKLVDTLEKK